MLTNMVDHLNTTLCNIYHMFIYAYTHNLPTIVQLDVVSHIDYTNRSKRSIADQTVCGYRQT